ncbi:MAG: protein kinase [Chloroflexi bacterium]|nr:protein kinase [Chloroflexota bacterium]
MDDLTGKNIKGYELQERIGQGGFGEVYRAHQTAVGRQVAIKIILPKHANKPDFIRRFEAEAHLVARLEHMNIVPLHDYWREPDGAFLVMRYMRGGSLRNALLERKLTLNATVRIMEQITSALGLAHRNNVIHRDLKPANILLDEDGNAYLSDFGIAKDLTKIEEGLTAADKIIGSPDYLSPEQARGEDVSRRADIYSLGIVLYELLTGNHPFPDLTPIQRLFKHINEPVPYIETLSDDISAEVNDVIARATQKDPQSRFDDVVELMSAFREAIGFDSKITGPMTAQLSIREHEILSHILSGKSNREISMDLSLSDSTISWHIRNIYTKLGVRSRSQIIARAEEMDAVHSGDTITESPTVIGTTLTLSSITIAENPYKGLRAFQLADSKDFFGRDTLIDKLLDRMKHEGDLSRFLAVVGPSGSGKSSLVKAGLIPAVRQGELPGSVDWFIVDMLPGDRPLDELEVALTKIATGDVGNLREQLERDERGLVRASQLILPDDDSQLLLVVDQFEEVFTLTENEEETTRFLKLILSAVTAPRSRVRVVVTLRADFYDRPLQYPDFGELMRERTETVLPLSAEQLQQSITGPAKRVGAKFEDGLVAAIISDVHYQPGALPLLQYAMTELFERRNGGIMTLQAYEEIGRATGALAKRADEIFQTLDENSQKLARQIFLRLITLGEGTEDTRRRVNRRELEAITTEVDTLNDLIDTYVEYRLFTLDNDPATRQPTIEVAHEAIIREWEQLRDWLASSREDIRLHRRLAAEVNEWLSADRADGFLARGARLEQYETWANTTSLALTRDEQRFLDHSIERRVVEQQEEAARKAREAKIARRAQNFQRASAVLAVVLVLAVIASIIAALTARSANEEVRTANVVQTDAAVALDEANTEVARLTPISVTIDAAQAELEDLQQEIDVQQSAVDALVLAETASRFYQAQGNAELVALLSIRSLNLTYSPLADSMLVAVTENLRSLQIHPTEDIVSKALFSPDASQFATIHEDNIIRLWDTTGGSVVASLTGHQDKILDIAFSPDGRYLASGSRDGDILLWDLSTYEQVQQYVQDAPSDVVSLEFSPAGTLLATGHNNAAVFLWDVESGGLVNYFFGHNNRILDVRFSPDGRTLATSSTDQTIRLWDVNTGEETGILTGNTSGVSFIDFSPDGDRLVSGSVNGEVILWNAGRATLEKIELTISEQITAVDFSPDGTSLLIGHHDNLFIWDLEDSRELYSLSGHTDTITSGSFANDGDMVISSSEDLTIRLWDTGSGSQQIMFENPADDIRTVSFYLPLYYILMGTTDGNMHLVDVRTGAILQTYRGHTDVIQSTVFFGSGEYFASASQDQTIRIWDVDSREIVSTIEMPSRNLTSLRYSNQDREMLLVAAGGFGAILWDVEANQEIGVFQEDDEVVVSAAFDLEAGYLWTGDENGMVRQWNIQTKEVTRSFAADDRRIFGIGFTPDGQYMIISTSTLVKLWDIEDLTIAYSFRVAGGLAFSPDGMLVAASGTDQTVHIWELDHEEDARILVGHTGRIRGLAFTSDNQHLISVGDDGQIRWWLARYEDVIAEACLRLTRDLTEEERSTYGIENDRPTCRF